MKKNPKTKEKKYLYAFDPKIKRRVVHVLKDGWAISLITGNKFRFRSKNGKNKI